MSDANRGVGHDRLARLMKRGTDFLGCEVAIMGGAMSWRRRARGSASRSC